MRQFNRLYSGALKGMAVHTLVLIIMMGLFAIFGFWLFYKWSDMTGVETTKASCTFKKIAYCTDWKVNNYGTEPWSWADKNPKDCESVGIAKPTSSKDCEGI